MSTHSLPLRVSYVDIPAASLAVRVSLHGHWGDVAPVAGREVGATSDRFAKRIT